ncbi:MAG: serine hydrolase domain-containing protein [Candidatus Nitrosopolaris sp.]
MFFNYNTKIFFLLFTVVLVSTTIVVRETITSVSGLSPTISHTYLTSSSPQNNIPNNLTSTFKITDEIKHRINALLDSNRTNAAIVIGIVDPNGTQFYSTGKMSKANNSTVNQNTIFAIGSNTKIFTTTLLADMVQDGLVKLNDPVDKYLPSNVKVPQYNGHKITIEDLATHTSGFPEFPSNYCPRFFKVNPQTPDEKVQLQLNLMACTKNYTFDQFYQGLSNTTLPREPGLKVEYSTFGSALLGNILTLKSNMSSYDELVTKRILNVLGMNSTSINLSDEQKSRLAIGHLLGRELPLLNFSNPMVPGGGLYSSASDMLKFISANIGLIKTKLDNAMQESHLIRHSTGMLIPNNIRVSGNNTNPEFYVGLGWFITTNLGKEIIWHNGATGGGYNAFMAFSPTTDRGIVVLCSTDVSNVDISTLGLNQKGKLSSLIWNLLSQ